MHLTLLNRGKEYPGRRAKCLGISEGARNWNWWLLGSPIYSQFFIRPHEVRLFFLFLLIFLVPSICPFGRTLLYSDNKQAPDPF